MLKVFRLPFRRCLFHHKIKRKINFSASKRYRHKKDFSDSFDLSSAPRVVVIKAKKKFGSPSFRVGIFWFKWSILVRGIMLNFYNFHPLEGNESEKGNREKKRIQNSLRDVSEIVLPIFAFSFLLSFFDNTIYLWFMVFL